MDSVDKALFIKEFLFVTIISYTLKLVQQSHHVVIGKAVPLQTWSGAEGSRKLKFPDFMTTAQDGGKVVSLTHRSPLPPGNIPGTHSVRG
jgi:hypothetical protein